MYAYIYIQIYQLFDCILELGNIGFSNNQGNQKFLFSPLNYAKPITKTDFPTFCFLI